MMEIAPGLQLDPKELHETFVRASGPGGQNVNKVSTAVELRFDVRRSPSLPNDVAIRLERIAAHLMTQDGVLVLLAQRHRTQDLNRADARERLFDLIRKAAVAPKKRRPTKPTKASVERRLQSKVRRSSVKRQRQGRPDAD